jgi:uncharacterized protein (TIGR00730 family)
MASVCVFCGSKAGDHPGYSVAARQLGQFLCRNNHTLIYGGGSTGIMGVIADAVLEGKGRIVGVIPKHLARTELMHSAVEDMHVTGDMHERKALMHKLSDLYIALPGGFGTMEELFEAVTWAQLDLHTRPIAVLNIHGVYDGLVQLVDSMEASGFLSEKCRSIMSVVEDTEGLFTWLARVTREHLFEK